MYRTGKSKKTVYFFLILVRSRTFWSRKSRNMTWSSGGYGVRVQMSAKVTCHGCMARNNKGAGYLAHTFGTLEVIDCSSDKDRYGGCILEASTFIAKNLTVRHALYDGFEIRSRFVFTTSFLWSFTKLKTESKAESCERNRGMT